MPGSQPARIDLWNMPLLTELEIGLCLISIKISHLTVLKAFVCQNLIAAGNDLTAEGSMVESGCRHKENEREEARENQNSASGI